MSEIIVVPHGPLYGNVRISGSKNSSLPILAASLLADSPSIIHDLPNLTDMENMAMIIQSLGGQADIKAQDCYLFTPNIITHEAPYDLVKSLRASFLVAGPLLARAGKFKLPLPGGCPIGSRPVDLHLKGFSSLGAIITINQGYAEAYAENLRGAGVYLDFPSVGATENILMAACLADGQTIIENAATEPEISDLANYLCRMGAEIRGAGTDTIKITGVKTLHGAEHTVIPDRIEAGTYMTAAAVTRGVVTVHNIVPEHQKPLMAKLRETGVVITEKDNCITVDGRGMFHCAEIKTLPFPGFPTDMQSQVCSLLTVTEGTSLITETVFENRFMYVPELCRMGADIKLEGRTAVIRGKDKLSGTSVTATDLRAGASLVLAALAAEGETRISGAEHIKRGYDSLPLKFNSLGAEMSWLN